jgi:hypothetical protein
MDLTRYHDVLDEVSDPLADHLHDDAKWLESKHPRELDAMMFKLMMLLGDMTLKKLMVRLCFDQLETWREVRVALVRNLERRERQPDAGTSSPQSQRLVG